MAGKAPQQQQLLPGQIIAQQAAQQQQQKMMAQQQQQQGAYGECFKIQFHAFNSILCIFTGGFPQPHAEYSTDTVIYKGGPPAQQPPRGPLPSVSFKSQAHKINTMLTLFLAQADEEFPPPPPERGNGSVQSADTSLNDR